jgi:hypothetical protein
MWKCQEERNRLDHAGKCAHQALHCLRETSLASLADDSGIEVDCAGWRTGRAFGRAG